jgi:NtrC-family two-component system sensor histidine kinase KinB
LTDELESTVREIETAFLRAGRLNAAAAHETTLVIASVRRMLLPAAIALEIACIVAAALALAAAYRVARVAADASDEARAALEQRASELDAFSARVAHDVLAPLQSVSLALSLAERGLGPSPDDRGRVAVTRAQATLDRVRQMCADLLEFARAGAAPLAAECDPAPVLTGVLEDLVPIAEQAGVAIDAAVGPVRRVRCAAGVLGSIVSNLVRNAIQHGARPEAGRVVLRVFDEGCEVHFEVEDSGPGIPVEEQASVFDPYVRGTGARVTGLGLGLATVRRLVHANGGEVGVRSEPGRGARFWFTLPAA